VSNESIATREIGRHRQPSLLFSSIAVKQFGRIFTFEQAAEKDPYGFEKMNYES
jgi:hypothetical protein